MVTGAGMARQQSGAQARRRPQFAQFVLTALLALCADGCGAQRGRFVTTSDKSQMFSTAAGCVDIVRGYKAGAFGRTVGPEVNLLFLVVVCPNMASGASTSTSADYGEKVTALRYAWRGRTNSAAVEVRWDRRADTVLVGSAVVQRSRGNLVVVRCLSEGHVECQQLSDLGPDVGHAEVLESVRRQLPGDQFVASLRF